MVMGSNDSLNLGDIHKKTDTIDWKALCIQLLDDIDKLKAKVIRYEIEIIKLKKEMGHELEDDEKEVVARNFTYRGKNQKKVPKDARGQHYRKTKGY